MRDFFFVFFNARDPWFGLDKIAHFSGCMLIVLIGTLVFGNMWVPFTMSVAIGFFKEVYDYHVPESHTCSYRDCLAAWAGAIFGGVVLYVAHAEHVTAGFSGIFSLIGGAG